MRKERGGSQGLVTVSRMIGGKRGGTKKNLGLELH